METYLITIVKQLVNLTPGHVFWGQSNLTGDDKEAGFDSVIAQHWVSNVIVIAFTIVEGHHTSMTRRFLSQQNIIPHDVPERIPTAAHDVRGVFRLCNKLADWNFQRPNILLPIR